MIKNIISPRGRDFLLHRRKKRYAELTGISNCKNGRIKSLSDNKLIGRFSVLSISPIANITSFYNGKAYYYVMNRDIDQLHIDLLEVKDTDEHNGVEVKAPVTSFDLKNLQCLSFIENVYVQYQGYDNELVKQFNKRKITSCKNFKVIDTYIPDSRFYVKDIEVLLGKIPYKIDFSELYRYSDPQYDWKETFRYIYPTIEIGSVDITPNRESLLYSERTKQVLRDAYDKCIEELTQMWNDKQNEEYEDFKLWLDKIICPGRNAMEIGGLDMPMPHDLPTSAIFKSRSEWNNLDPKTKQSCAHTLVYHQAGLLCELADNTFYKGRSETERTVKKVMDSMHYNHDGTCLFYIIPSLAGFSGKYMKSFLTEKHPHEHLHFIRKREISLRAIRSFILQTWGVSTYSRRNERLYITQLIIETIRYFSSKCTVSDIINTPEYQKYKKDHAEPKNTSKKFNGEITFTITNTELYDIEKETCTLDRIIRIARRDCSKKARIVYADLDSPFISSLKSMRYPNLIILSAAKSNMRYLKEGLPSWVRPIEELYSPTNRVFIKYVTALHIYNHGGIRYTEQSFYPEDVNAKIRKIREYVDEYAYKVTEKDFRTRDTIQSLLNVIPEGTYDMDILGTFHEVLPYMKKSYQLANLEYSTSDRWLMFLLMKCKKLKLSYPFYKNMKDKLNQNIETLCA